MLPYCLLLNYAQNGELERLQSEMDLKEQKIAHINKQSSLLQTQLEEKTFALDKLLSEKDAEVLCYCQFLLHDLNSAAQKEIHSLKQTVAALTKDLSESKDSSEVPSCCLLSNQARTYWAPLKLLLTH
jgi:hypothetical protein